MIKKAKRKATQAQRKASRSPGGMAVGGPVPTIDPRKRHLAEQAAIKRNKALNRKRAKAATSGAKGLRRRATRSPGGFSGGGTVESYSAQVQRKYGGGKV